MYNDQKIAIRPILDLDNDASDTDIIVFQNKTLRPILKLQNSLLRSIAAMHIPKLTNIQLDKERRVYIQEYLNKNPLLTHLLVGTIVGFFTDEELAFYHANVPRHLEVNKRIKTMIIERIVT
jgi:hypothetical protein